MSTIDFLPDVWESIYRAHTVDEAVQNYIADLKLCYDKYNDKRIMILIKKFTEYRDMISNDFKRNRTIFNHIHENTVDKHEDLFVKTSSRIKSFISFQRKCIRNLMHGECFEVRDIFAFRTAIDSQTIAEEDLIKKCYEIMEENIDFMISKGFTPCIANKPKDTNDFIKDNFPEIIIPEKSFLKTDTSLVVKDYILNPKKDSYQSLHCIFIDARGRAVEYQIRTYKMDHNAEYGPASHNDYKNRQNKDITESTIHRENIQIPGYCFRYNKLSDDAGLEKSFPLLLREHRLHS